VKTTTDAPRLLTWCCELQDTFGGEANGSWKNRQTVELPTHATDRAIVRAGKAALGLTGVRCRTSHLGGCEGFELRPYGSSTVAFITLGEKE
jgi:hypothetical protein